MLLSSAVQVKFPAEYQVPYAETDGELTDSDEDDETLVTLPAITEDEVIFCDAAYAPSEPRPNVVVEEPT